MPTETSYLTSEGAQKLQEELEFLKGPAGMNLPNGCVLRLNREISLKMRIIRQQKRNKLLWKEDQELETILSNVKIIDDLKREKGVVNLGSTVRIQEEDFEPEEIKLSDRRKRIR